MLKNENRINENLHAFDGLTKRIEQIEKAGSKMDKVTSVIAGKGERLDSKSLIEAIMSVTNDVQVNMVHRDEFLDMRAEVGNLLESVNDLSLFKKTADQRIVDDHYQMVKNTHLI